MVVMFNIIVSEKNPVYTTTDRKYIFFLYDNKSINDTDSAFEHFECNDLLLLSK